MFCSNCGANLPEGSVFCSFCGRGVIVQPSAPTSPQPKPEAKKVGKLLTPPSRWKKAFTIILAIFMVLALLAASFVGALGHMFTENSLNTVLNKIEFSKLTFSNGSDTQTLADAINSSVLSRADGTVLDNGEIAVLTMTDEDIENIFAIEEIREFIVDTILGYTDCLIFGKALNPISAEEIADFISESEDLIVQKCGKAIFFAEREIMVEEMNAYFNFSQIESERSIEQMIGFNLSWIRFGFNDMYFILLGIAGFFLLLIALINIKNLPACLTITGIAVMIFSICMLSIGVGAIVGTNMLSEILIARLIAAVVAPLTYYFIVWGIVAFILGLALIFLRKFWLKPRFEKAK